MIEGIPLPKGQASAAENLVRLPRAPALQPLHHRKHLLRWENQHVHMIRHHNPSMKFVKPLLNRPNQNRLGNQIRNPRVVHPYRPWLSRNRTLQPPGDKQTPSIGMKMRQLFSIFSHLKTSRRKSPSLHSCPYCPKNLLKCRAGGSARQRSPSMIRSFPIKSASPMRTQDAVCLHIDESNYAGNFLRSSRPKRPRFSH